MDWEKVQKQVVELAEYHRDVAEAELDLIKRGKSDVHKFAIGIIVVFLAIMWILPRMPI
jgi:hypothetical protein